MAQLKIASTMLTNTVRLVLQNVSFYGSNMLLTGFAAPFSAWLVLNCSFGSHFTDIPPLPFGISPINADLFGVTFADWTLCNNSNLSVLNTTVKAYDPSVSFISLEPNATVTVCDNSHFIVRSVTASYAIAMLFPNRSSV